MKIKTTKRYYLILVIMAIIKKTRNECWQGQREKGTSLLMEMYIGATTMESSIEAPQKIGTQTILRSSNSTSEYISKENENTDSK